MGRVLEMIQDYGVYSRSKNVGFQSDDCSRTKKQSSEHTIISKCKFLRFNGTFDTKLNFRLNYDS